MSIKEVVSGSCMEALWNLICTTMDQPGGRGDFEEGCAEFDLIVESLSVEEWARIDREVEEGTGN